MLRRRHNLGNQPHAHSRFRNLDCQVIKPDKARREGQIIQFPVGKTNGNRPLHVRRLLDLRFNNPRTLGDPRGWSR